MGKYKDAKEYAKETGYDEDLTRREWKGLKKLHGGAAGATAWMKEQELIGEQKEEVKRLEGLQKEQIDKVLALYKEGPGYQMSPEIRRLMKVYDTVGRDIIRKGAQMEAFSKKYGKTVRGIGEQYDNVVKAGAQQLGLSSKELEDALKTGGTELQNILNAGANKLNISQQKLTQLTEGVGEIISGRYGEAGQIMTGLAGQLAQRGELLGQTFERAARGVGRAGADVREILDAGADQMLSVYERLAAEREMPGEELVEQQFKQQTAEAIRDIRTMGGGAGGFQAIADIYQAQQNAIMNLAIQSKQYRTQTQMNLADAYTTASQIKAGAREREIGTMREAAELEAAGLTGSADLLRSSAISRIQGMETDIGILERGAAMRERGLMAGAELGRQGTLMRERGARSRADMTAAGVREGAAMRERALGMRERGLLTRADIETQAAQAELSAISDSARLATAGAMMRGEGLEAMAGERQQQFYYNQYQPWAGEVGFRTGLTNMYNPIPYKFDVMGTELGLLESHYQNYLAAREAKRSRRMDLIGGLIGGGAQVGSSMIDAKAMEAAAAGAGGAGAAGAGAAGAGGAGAAAAASSKDYKYDIVENKHNSIELIKGLEIKNFKYKPEMNIDEKEYVGVIAEDTPDILTTKDKKAFDMYSAIGILLDANKKLIQRIETLENGI